MSEDWKMKGNCTCGHIQFELLRKPLFVHCCHCTWCQRETGSAFALNAIIESEYVELLSGKIEKIDTPSASGKGQLISRCPICKVAVWSNYAGAGEIVRFVRVGTLEHPEKIKPDVHIYTSTKVPWVQIPPGAPSFTNYYKLKETWPEESQKRRQFLLAKHKQN